MRTSRSASSTLGGPHLPTRCIAGLVLLALVSGGAGAAEFGPPHVLPHPDPEPGLEEAEWEAFGTGLAVDRRTLAVSGSRVTEEKSLSEVYIFERQGQEASDWRLSQRLSSDRLGPLGGVLALDGDTLAVLGRPSGRRVIYIFERDDAGVWRRRRTLRPNVLGVQPAMSLDRDRLAVGVPYLSRVLIFERNKPTRGRWGLTARVQGELTSPAYTVLDADQCPGETAAPGFGASVALSGDRLVVGALSRRSRCGKPGANTNGIFIFARDLSSPTGWTQLHNFASPGRRSLPPGLAEAEDSPFGQIAALAGPFLLAGWGAEADQAVTNLTRLHLYERNHRGPDRWGYRRELRRGLWTADPQEPKSAVVRGNTAVLVEEASGSVRVSVFERDHPGRDSWGLAADLPRIVKSSVFGTPLALGPRELVVGDQRDNRVLIFPRAPIQGDDFESGDTSAWTGRRGRVTVVGPGLDGSDAALAVAVGGGDARASFVASNRPRREPSLSVDFSLLPNSVDLAGKQVEILRFYAGKPALRLFLEERAITGDYGLLLQTRTRSGVWFTVGSVRVPGSEASRIEIEYRAPTASGAQDGRVRLSVNGRQVRQKLKIDQERMLINRIVLGLPVGSPPAAGGSFLIDDFALHR